jgi:hypothetical protein
MPKSMDEAAEVWRSFQGEHYSDVESGRRPIKTDVSRWHPRRGSGRMKGPQGEGAILREVPIGASAKQRLDAIKLSRAIEERSLQEIRQQGLNPGYSEAEDRAETIRSIVRAKRGYVRRGQEEVPGAAPGRGPGKKPK